MMQTSSMFSKSSSSTTTAASANTTTMNNTQTPSLPKVRFNWIFPAERFQSTPTMRDGLSADKELSCRQESAVFIHELGSSLKLPHYCISTAVVYMHRFFMINSFQKLNQYQICAACLFLACKVEECTRSLREVVDNISRILKRKQEHTKELIAQYTDDILLHENILLSTLGFSLIVDHPYSLIVKTIQALGGQIQSLPEKTPRELAQTAYYLATKSILLTSFCVKYPPDLIAGFCIHLAAAWLKIEMPSPSVTDSAASSGSSTETSDPNNTGGRRWFHLLNISFTEKQLEELANEFLAIYEKCPDKIKKKLVYQNERSQTSNQDIGATSSQSSSSRPTDLADSVVPQGAAKTEKTEHRQTHPPLPLSRPPQQPPLPSSSHHQPPPPPPPVHPHPTQPSSGAVRRDHPTSATNFSSSNRPPSQSSRPASYQQSQQQQLPPQPNHYQQQHHNHQGYHQNSRYPSQHQRPNSMPPHRTNQQQAGPGMTSQYIMDRKSSQPMSGTHPYDHQSNVNQSGPPPPPPPSSSSSSSGNRGSHPHQQRSFHHGTVPPTGKNPYPPQGGNMNHPHHPHSHPQSRMMMTGEKRNYESSYDPNHSKRARPS